MMSRFHAVIFVLIVTAIGTGACALVAWFVARMGGPENPE